MRYFEDEISGIDGSTATFVGYCLDNSSEIDPNRKRPSVLVIPGGGYEMTSDREAEPIAMQFLAAGFNAFVLRYSVKPSIFPVALLEAAEAMRRIRTHADEWHCDADAIAVIGFSAGGHGLSLGTAETAWQGVNGIEPCVQVWPKLAIAWMRRTFAATDATAAMTGSATTVAIAE